MDVENLLEKVEEYNPKDVEIVKEAYKYASEAHKDQMRESGEPYITHPTAVAYKLAEQHADTDTICAGLLHDVIEDSDATKEDLAHIFNPTIANLVDCVTKFARTQFSTKQEQNLANLRKMLRTPSYDIRAINIKLCDRAHNMETLKFKKNKDKQRENATETMNIYVPLAYNIGAYNIKNELEDLSFKYINPEQYSIIEEMKLKTEEESKSILQEMLFEIQGILNDKNIPNSIKVRTKNIYGIYKRLNSGHKMNDIHDLLAMKIIVDSIEECYQTLGIVHSKYNPVNNKFKDYICNPKTNLYQSIHTTLFGPNGRLVQTQIRTEEMDKIASYGLAAYWDIDKEHAAKRMQEIANNKIQFFKSLSELDAICDDNQEFVDQANKELLTTQIYVCDNKGNRIELPTGATVIDFAYRTDINLGDIMVGAVVNDEYVAIDTPLKNKDRVSIITNEGSYGPRTEWLDQVVTSTARRRISNFSKKAN